MALNKVFAYDERKVRVRTVPAGTKVGAGILVNGRPAFVIAANTGETQNTTLPDEIGKSTRLNSSHIV